MDIAGDVQVLLVKAVVWATSSRGRAHLPFLSDSDDVNIQNTWSK